MKRIIFKKATSKQNILNEKLHSEPTKCHSIMLEHNGKKCQNIIRSFCVPENVRTVIKRELYELTHLKNHFLLKRK